jgi:acetyl esterase/lipase
MFNSGADGVHGTLLVPAHAAGAKIPAAVIIAGSGPTDRDGNSTLEAGKIDTLKDIANVLASHGVASLRYDKLGTGATGLGSFASHPQDIGFDVYVQEANDAYDFLRRRPDIDPQRVIFVGHSEGALIAMVVTDALPAGSTPAALVLAAPPGNGYLETILTQLRTQYAAAVQAGKASQAQAGGVLADAARIVASLKASGGYPPGMAITAPPLASLFSAQNERFLAEVERDDPASVGARLPKDLLILILHGEKDEQVSDADITRLSEALRKSSHARVEVDSLPDADHVFKDVPGTPDAATDYTNPRLAFSAGAAEKLGAFADQLFGRARTPD